MRRLAILLLVLLTLGWSQAPETPLVPLLWEFIDTRQPVNTQWPLHRGLRYWWAVTPWLYGGSQWWDLINHKPATLTNMAASEGWKTDPQGWHAGQVVFDGTDDYVTTAGLLGTPIVITVSVVALTTSGASGTSNQFFALGDYVGLQVNSSDQLEWAYYSGGSWVTNTISWGRNGTGWHHVVYGQATNNTSGHAEVFIDGIQVYDLTGDFPNIVYTGQGTDTYFGRHGNSSSRFLHGAIADVRVWDRLLTASEVQFLYQDIQDRGRFAFQRRLPQSLLNVSGGIPPGFLH